MRTLLTILALLFPAVELRAGWIVDQAFTVKSYGEGVGGAGIGSLATHDVDSSGVVHGVIVGHGNPLRITEDGTTTFLPVDHVSFEEVPTAVRVGPNDESYFLCQYYGDGTGGARLYRSLNHEDYSLLLELPNGQKNARRMDVSPVNGDILIYVSESPRLLRYDDSGSLLYSTPVGFGLGGVAFDDEGNAYAAAQAGEVYTIDGSGNLTATGEAVEFSQFRRGGGSVASLAWHDDTLFFGVGLDADAYETNAASAFVRLLDGETQQIALGVGEVASDLSFFAGELYMPNNIGNFNTNSLSLTGATLAAGFAPLTVLQGDFNGPLLGFAEPGSGGGVPEPSSFALLLGLLTLFWIRRGG